MQIEITSRCPLQCNFCPNKALGKNWIHGDLPLPVYRDHIAPHLSRFDLAYLQGWGEPLLHPHLWEMVRLAKTAGCRVGFTSCGSLLDEAACARLLDEGVDILSISFAGATPMMHESLRIGSDYRKLAGNVERIARAKRTASAGQGQALPLLELHFLMMRSNIHELPEFVRMSAALGADEIVATNLAYAPTPALEAQRVFAQSPDPQHSALIAEAENEAKRLGIKFRAYPLAMERNTLECDAKPTDTAYINHLGHVAPCVYLGMPIRESAPRYFLGMNHAVTPVNFGNVGAGLPEALEGTARRTFNGAFRARQAFAYSALAMSAASGMADDLYLPAPPSACQHCYKMYGV